MDGGKILLTATIGSDTYDRNVCLSIHDHPISRKGAVAVSEAITPTDHAINQDPIYDRKGAARYLNNRFKPETFAKWDCTKRYDLKPFRVGRSICYRQSSLDAFLELYERQALDPNFKKNGGRL